MHSHIPRSNPVLPTDRKARVLLADDHVLVAEACKRVLEPEFEVVGIAENGRQLLRFAVDLKPDVIVLDIAMPQLNGLDAAQQLRELLPGTKVLFLTMNMEPDVAAEAFRRGAAGYVVKSSTVEELVTAVRRVLRSELYLSPTITRDTVEFLMKAREPTSGKQRLTPRQTEILQLLVEAVSIKEIAATLNLKPATIGFHKHRIMETLGLKTNAELLQYAIKHHLVA